MDYAGEGNFSMYFEQDQTGIGSLINQMFGGPGNALAKLLTSFGNAYMMKSAGLCARRGSCVILVA